MTYADTAVRSEVTIKWAEDARSDRLLILANLADEVRVEPLHNDGSSA